MKRWRVAIGEVWLSSSCELHLNNITSSKWKPEQSRWHFVGEVHHTREVFMRRWQAAPTSLLLEPQLVCFPCSVSQVLKQQSVLGWSCHDCFNFRSAERCIHSVHPAKFSPMRPFWHHGWWGGCFPLPRRIRHWCFTEKWEIFLLHLVPLSLFRNSGSRNISNKCIFIGRKIIMSRNQLYSKRNTYGFFVLCQEGLFHQEASEKEWWRPSCCTLPCIRRFAKKCLLFRLFPLRVAQKPFFNLFFMF